MERRNFLKQSVTAVAAAGLLGGCVRQAAGPAVQTQKSVRWTLVSSFPRSLDTIFGAADVLSARVAALTDGRFKIKVHQPGEIVPANKVFDAVRGDDAQAEVGHSAGYYYTGIEDALAFDTAVPFGMRTRQHSAWLTSGGGLEVMREVFGKFGIISFPGGNTGVQMGGWFRNPVGSLADLKGVKMRIPGLGGAVMDRLGVVVQNLSGGEIYQALELGTIDATDWVGPYDDQKLGFHQVVKNYHYPGWWEPGPALSFYVNKKAWDKLPSTYQQAFEVACHEAAANMQMEYDAKNPPALAQLMKEGVKLHPFAEDIMTAARREWDAINAEKVASNAVYRKVHEHWSKFKDESDRWFNTAERAYGDFIYKSLDG